MHKLLGVLIIIAGVLASFGRASAAEIPGSQFTVGQWSGAAYTSDDGSFNSCQMNAAYKSGITLLFFLGSNSWTMGLVNPAWALTQGQSYPVTYWIDNSIPQQASAVAITAAGVNIDLPLTAAEFNLFRYGNQLTVVAAAQTFYFNLTDTSSSLYALGTCALSRTQLATSNPFAASNPFTSGQPSAVSEMPTSGDRGALQAEATVVAANLLTNAGISYNFLPPDQIPAPMKGYLAVWGNASTLGFISIDPPESGVTASAQAARFIADDSGSCKDKFASGSMPDETSANGEVIHVFTACQGEKPISVFYQILPRRKGGLYVLGTISLGDPTPARQADESIRSVVLRTLNN